MPLPIRSSSFNPVYNTNSDGSLQVEVTNSISDNFTPIESTNYSINSTTNPVTLLPENVSRATTVIVNDSTADLYILFKDGTPSSNNYSIILSGKQSSTSTPSSTTFTGRDYSGIVVGAWSAVNGSAKITEITYNNLQTSAMNSNFLNDGVLINSVANFYRTSKPTTRINGSPLVIGDKWYNTTTGVEGFWNGTYWLSCQKYGPRGSYSFYGNEPFTTINDGLGTFVNEGAFIRDLTLIYKSQTNQNLSNYSVLGLVVRGARNAIDEINFDYFLPLADYIHPTTGIFLPLPKTSYTKVVFPINQFASTRGDIAIISANHTIGAGSPSFPLHASFAFDVRTIL